MTKRIFKYRLTMEIRDGCVGWDPEVGFDLPVGTTVLTAQAQGNSPMIWAEVDPDERKLERRRFLILNTGAEIPSRPLKYLNTIQLNEGRLIFHIYEVLS